MDGIDRFATYRPLLFSIAYRMLGSVEDAEDMVQETYLKWTQVSDTEILSPKRFLCTLITRRCIDHLRSARLRREEYVGVWLPEPLVTGEADDPGTLVTLNESLSTAFLMLLESLSPVERAVFVLREAFGYEYAEIAEMLGKSEANCRQLLRRARQHIRLGRPQRTAAPARAEEITRRFLTACTAGDITGLLAMLAEDATVWVDGGGKTHSGRRPVSGAEKVSRYLAGLARKTFHTSVFQIATINGGPGIIRYVDGEPRGVITLNIVDGRVQEVFYVVNPEKLKVPAALRARDLH